MFKWAKEVIQLIRENDIKMLDFTTAEPMHRHKNRLRPEGAGGFRFFVKASSDAYFFV